MYVLLPILFDLIGHYDIFSKPTDIVYTRTSIATLMIAVGLLGCAMQKETTQTRWVNQIASCTFGIYLFHFSIVDFLFDEFIPIDRYLGSWILTFFYLVVMTVVLFGIGLFVEMIRKKIEELYQPFVIKISYKSNNLWNWIIEKIDKL